MDDVSARESEIAKKARVDSRPNVTSPPHVLGSRPSGPTTAALERHQNDISWLGWDLELARKYVL